MPLRAAFIGTGGISAVHLDAVQADPDAEIVGLCDVSPDNLANRQASYGGETYTDAETMLDAVKPDAVWLCTPPVVRRDPLLACARRGIPVLCEKPAGRDLAASQALAAELDALGAHVQVAYVFRPTPLVQQLRQRIADDRIHTVTSTYICGMSIARSMPAWFFDKEKSGGGIVDQATHNFDLLRYLLGDVTQVQGLAHNPLHAKTDGYTVDETIALTLRFAGGAVATHIHSWVASGWKNEIVLHGEKRNYYLSPMSWLRINIPGQSDVTHDSPAGSKYVYENRVFMDAVRSGDWSANPSPYADAVKTLAVTTAADQAVSTGERVTL